MGEIDHVAPDAPFNVNIAAWPADKDALEGVKETVLDDAAVTVAAPAGMSVITAVPLSPAFPRLDAVNITVSGMVTVGGAV